VDCPLMRARYFGIESAQAALTEALQRVMKRTGGTGVHPHHSARLAAFLCVSGFVHKLDRFDMQEFASSVLAEASFETPKDVLLRAATFGERSRVDHSISSAAILSAKPAVGTGLVQVVVPRHLRVANLLARHAAAPRDGFSARPNDAAGDGRTRRPRGRKAPPPPPSFTWDISAPASAEVQAYRKFAWSRKRKSAAQQSRLLSVGSVAASVKNLAIPPRASATTACLSEDVVRNALLRGGAQAPKRTARDHMGGGARKRRPHDDDDDDTTATTCA
jgi:hypothetical protein